MRIRRPISKIVVFLLILSCVSIGIYAGWSRWSNAKTSGESAGESTFPSVAVQELTREQQNSPSASEPDSEKGGEAEEETPETRVQRALALGGLEGLTPTTTEADMLDMMRRSFEMNRKARLIGSEAVPDNPWLTEPQRDRALSIAQKLEPLILAGSFSTLAEYSRTFDGNYQPVTRALVEAWWNQGCEALVKQVGQLSSSTAGELVSKMIQLYCAREANDPEQFLLVSESILRELHRLKEAGLSLGVIELVAFDLQGTVLEWRTKSDKGENGSSPEELHTEASKLHQPFPAARVINYIETAGLLKTPA